jgi:hypothetical protein
MASTPLDLLITGSLTAIHKQTLKTHAHIRFYSMYENAICIMDSENLAVYSTTYLFFVFVVFLDVTIYICCLF